MHEHSTAGHLQSTIERFLAIAMNAVVPAIVLWKYHSGDLNKTSALSSAAICLVAIPLGFAWIVRARHKRSQLPIASNVLALSILAALACFAVTALGVAKLGQGNNCAELAASNIALNDIQPERTRLVVELIRRTAANSRENDKSLDEIRKNPIDPPVYSPQSFASHAAMDSTVHRVTQIVNADVDYYHLQQAARQDFREKMASCDPTFLRSWDQGRPSQENLEKSTEAIQREWFASFETLYVFAETHSKEVTVSNGQLKFATEDIQKTFAQLMDRCKSMNDELQHNIQAEAKAQQEAQARISNE